MEEVSESYNPYASEIRASAKAQFELIDVDAADMSSAAVNIDAVPFTELSQVTDKITENTRKLASLEQDLWALDGSFSLPNDDASNGETGYWSDAISDENGNIDLSFTFSFDEAQSSKGFTVIFDTKTQEVAADFTISVYNGSTLLNSASVTGNSEVFRIVDCPAENYNLIRLNFTKTAKPYRRIRLTEFVFGYLQEFSADKIVNLKAIYETSLYMENLPTNKLELTIDNTDRAYNVLNPTGIYRYLQEGQGLNASVTINGDTVSLGRFFFETATANSNALTATIVAYDPLYSMDETLYNLGVSGTWTLNEAVASVIADSGINVEVNIPADIGARLVGKNIPTETTHREALRLIAQAGMTNIYVNRLNQLTAKDFVFDEALDFLTAANMQNYGDAQDAGLINTVILTVPDDSEAGETIYTATNQTASQPYRAITVTNPLALGQEVAEWILTNVSRRNKYTLQTMGNPARDIADCISIANVYGTSENAAVLRQETTYNGSVLDTVTAR